MAQAWIKTKAGAMQGAWKQGNGAGECVRGGGRGWVARLSKEEGGGQQLCEVGQTEWWGLGTRASQRGEGGREHH